MTNTKQLTEAFVFEDQMIGQNKNRIDAEGCVIRGVKVLGLHSNNSPATIGVRNSNADHYTYSLDAIKEAASLYEGVRVNIDHPNFQYDGSGKRQAITMQRGLEDQFGWLENVVVNEQGLYADLHYFGSHPMAARVVEMTERKPGNIGLSHVAVTKPVTKPDGSVEIEKIIDVMSVDLIGDKPGTVSSLFESTNKEAVKMDPVDSALAAKKEEEETKPAPTSEMEDQEKEETKTAEMDDLEPASSVDAVKAGIQEAILEILADESLDEAGVIEKVTALIKLRTQAKSTISGDTPAAEMSDEDEKKEATTPESKAILAKLDSLEKGQQALVAENSRLKAESLLQLNGVKPNPANVKAVLACESQAEITQLVEGMHKGFTTPSNPRSGASVYESAHYQPQKLDQESLADTASKLIGR